MGMKLFDDADGNVEDISRIEINREFAKRFEHNKKREDLQRLEEMKKKGLVEDSASESESESSDDDDDNVDMNSNRKEVEFFDALLKVRRKDPILKEKDKKLFELSDSSDEAEEEEESGKEKVKKPKYLKDVVAQHLIEEGPEFDEGEENLDGKKAKTYAEEQEDLRKAFLDVVAEAEGEAGGDLLREKERGGDDDEEGDDGEIDEKLVEYFGDDEKLNENERFLKDFFKNKLWIDKDKGKNPLEDDEEIVDFSDDEEEIEKQEDYEREYNFRFEENAGDRVMGHSRFVEGTVRKETNARKRQRETKKERMAQAELERKEEVKRLKNLKKKEIQEKLSKIREIAGISGDGNIPLTVDDLEEDFDPDEFDKKMKAAFGDEYYHTEDVDPEFGSDRDESDLEKPDFEKEDELLGLPKDWDVCKPGDGFLAEREKNAKRKAENKEHEDEEEEDQGGENEGEPEKGKRKRKRKLSLKEKVALDKELEELYKLDYEDTIGDLKTRFKYKSVEPKRFGLSASEILTLDEKELNQYVSLKKIAPYREKEWRVPREKRYNIKKRTKMLLEEQDQKMGRKKMRRTDDGHGATNRKGDTRTAKEQGEQPNGNMGTLSRGARRRRQQAAVKLSRSRLIAYGKIPSSSKNKSKN